MVSLTSQPKCYQECDKLRLICILQEKFRFSFFFVHFNNPGNSYKHNLYMTWKLNRQHLLTTWNPAATASRSFPFSDLSIPLFTPTAPSSLPSNSYASMTNDYNTLVTRSYPVHLPIVCNQFILVQTLLDLTAMFATWSNLTKYDKTISPY